MRYFHFTIGPVQSFVGQARRTRDFWTGSFLLSWLSAIAMQSVISQNGKIVFPKADEKFLDAIKNGGDNGPIQGSIPNRFKAEVSTEFKPEIVLKDVKSAWIGLGAEIFSGDLKKIDEGVTKKIWDRQVNSFWDMAWILTKDINKNNFEDESSGLNRRKNWRCNYTPDEPGIKCTLMGNWQELSGVEGVRFNDRNKREGFWKKLENKEKTDFAEKEMLCAMSFIKRRFYKYFPLYQAKLSFGEIKGWKVPRAVPSVSYIAASTWYANLIAKSRENEKIKKELNSFHILAKEYNPSEYKSFITCIDKVDEEGKYKNIDGNVFYDFILDNKNKSIDINIAKKLKKQLQVLTKEYGEVSPFYAVLMMDGDSLGTQMSDLKKQSSITKNLAKFTEGVPSIVSQNNGFLIYAGGDDVLAIITLENALSCAKEIRSYYEKCFAEDKKNKLISTSISAAIIYTHINTPLKNILHESHSLLDNIAKEASGRDSFAIRVYKGSGLVAEWANKWENKNLLTQKSNVVNLQNLIDNFVNASQTDECFSSKFFYKIDQHFYLLYKNSLSKHKEFSLSFEQQIDLMAMEYLRSINNNDVPIENAREIVRQLLTLSFNRAFKEERISVDAALIIRFLAQKGLEGGNFR